ncbi:ABC transporter substrate-binding protein [Deinococcus apachensis]|uniref:ABC transporter substrate-binding protein n=1 Tax=Deinococcus apachensis TaxID=309886 RepID=UPI00037182E2|nr:ABC transporter substrate-binding protein [Deinococcus apachensis]
MTRITRLLTLGALLGGAALAQQPTKITFWNFLGGGDGARMKTLIDGYNASQKKYQIQQTVLQWGVPFYTKVRTSTSVGQAPDLISFHLSRISGWAPANLLRPITTQELSSAGLKQADFFPRLWNAATYQGKLYAVPLDTHPLVLYYNKDVARKAGLLDASGNLKPMNSVDQFTAALKAVKDKTGLAGLDMENHSTAYMPWRLWLTMVEQQGGSIVTNNKISAGEAGKKALSIMADWMKNGYMPKNSDYPSSVAQFTTGKTAFMINGVWEVPTMVDGRKTGKLPFDYGVAPLPKFFGNQDTWGDSHGFAIPNNARKPIPADRLAGVMDFIAYVQKNSLTWAQGGHIPAYLPVVNSAKYTALKPNSGYAKTSAANVTYDPPGWYSGAAGPLEAVSIKYFPAAMAGQLSVDKAMSLFESEANRLMAGRPKP